MRCIKSSLAKVLPSFLTLEANEPKIGCVIRVQIGTIAAAIAIWNVDAYNCSRKNGIIVVIEIKVIERGNEIPSMK